jgi:Na+-transporting NADH:ubiquinone oxidoreductase subunit C
MNTNKNSYTLIYAIVMVVVVALLLALVSSGLKDIQTNNVKLDKKNRFLVH